jgi:hypothetical protein
MVRQPSESCLTLVVADIILYHCHRARCVAVSGPMGPILPPISPILRWFWPDISRTTIYLAHHLLPTELLTVPVSLDRRVSGQTIGTTQPNPLSMYGNFKASIGRLSPMLSVRRGLIGVFGI